MSFTVNVSAQQFATSVQGTHLEHIDQKSHIEPENQNKYKRSLKQSKS